jgi:hypothetical protein
MQPAGERERHRATEEEMNLTERLLRSFEDSTVNIRPKFLECLTHNVQADI